MAAIDKEKKSSRLLASRRYTHDTYTDSQEAFTRTVDLSAEEIYTQASYVPSSDLPFSGSSQNLQSYMVSGSNVLKYWYRWRLTKSNTNNEVWFFLNPTGSSDGIGAQLISTDQEVNFISPKYTIPSLGNAVTEDTTPGYGVVLYKATTTDSSSLDSGDKISVNDYTFDYKTGVVQFTNSSVDPSNSDYVYMTAYQYTGTTLATGLDIRGSVTASNMFLDGTIKFGDSDTDTIEINAEYSGSLIPDVDDAFDIGEVGKEWKDLHIDGTANIDSLAVTDAFTYGSTTWNENAGALQVTGSDFFFKSTGGGFDIYDNSDALMFKIENKVAVLGARETPSAQAGGIFYSSSDAFYFGYENEVS
jgi:hypothetical protein|tara:strand:- start:268 stop:1347 length:1080 start_codon:yes stop_codon:yes gene_type:complete